MTFADWIRESWDRVKDDGVQGLRDSAYQLWIGGLRRTDRWADPGTNYYDREWDVLVVLDATRIDAMREVAADYDFVDEVETVYSPGSATYQWLERTFSEEYADEMARTTYVAGNPFTKEYLDSAAFDLLEEVWRVAWLADPLELDEVCRSPFILRRLSRALTSGRTPPP